MKLGLEKKFCKFLTKFCENFTPQNLVKRTSKDHPFYNIQLILNYIWLKFDDKVKSLKWQWALKWRKLLPLFTMFLNLSSIFEQPGVLKCQLGSFEKSHQIYTNEFI